jgi:hypothetical protein
MISSALSFWKPSAAMIGPPPPRLVVREQDGERVMQSLTWGIPVGL